MGSVERLVHLRPVFAAQAVLAAMDWEVPMEPRLDDEIHAWLKRMRDLVVPDQPAWTAIDWLVGDYEMRADKGLSLAAEDDKPTREAWRS